MCTALVPLLMLVEVLTTAVAGVRCYQSTGIVGYLGVLTAAKAGASAVTTAALGHGAAQGQKDMALV